MRKFPFSFVSFFFLVHIHSQMVADNDVFLFFLLVLVRENFVCVCDKHHINSTYTGIVLFVVVVPVDISHLDIHTHTQIS